MAKRKMSEKSLENLEKGIKFCAENATINAEKSHEVRREKAMVRQAMQGKMIADPTIKERIADVIIDGCLAGNVAMLKLYTEMMPGEKETEKLELVGTQDLQISLTVKD